MQTKLTSLMPHATIRSLSLTDYSQFVELEELVAFEQSGTPRDHAPPHWSQEEFGDYLNRGEIVKGVFDHHKLFAFYIFYMKSDELYITEMGVHPHYRRQGFGKCIMLLLENEATCRNLKKCTLSVDRYFKSIHIYLFNIMNST
ncbi:MAG: hypothetical protein S4CHLAM7_05100 [Chlamydiae bacterium]|nr:hypothetical protein [Chlamydiota bacterium]